MSGLGLAYWSWKALQGPKYQAVFANHVTAYLPDPWNKNTKIGRLGGRWPGYLLIQDATLQNANGDKLKIKELQIAWDWRSLWYRKLIINSIYISDLEGTIFKEPSGTWLSEVLQASPPELQPATSKSFDPRPFLVELKTLRIVNFTASFHNRCSIAEPNISWKKAQIQINRIHVKAGLDAFSGNIIGQVESSINASFALDEKPIVQLTGLVVAEASQEKFSGEIKDLQFKSPRSQMLLHGHAKLDGDWINHFSHPENMLDHLQTSLTIDTLQLHQEDLWQITQQVAFQDKPLQQLRFPDMIKINAQSDLQQRKLNTQLSLTSGNTHIHLLNNIERVESELSKNILHTQVELSSNVQEWAQDVEGILSLQLKIHGRPNLAQELVVDQKLSLTSGAYKNIFIPSFTLQSEFKNQTLQSHLFSQNSDQQLSMSVHARFPSCETWTSLDWKNIEIDAQQKAQVNNITKFSEFFPKILNPKSHLGGVITETLSLSGNAQQLRYAMSIQTANLVLDKALPKSIQCSASGNLRPLRLLESAPKMPQIFHSPENLKEDMQALGSTLQHWHQRVEWPNIKLQARGQELHPNIDHLDFEVSTGANKSLLLAAQAGLGSNTLLDFRSELQVQAEVFLWSFSKFSVQASSLLPKPWPWLDQALQLHQTAHLSVHWNEARLIWSGFDFGSDRWLTSTGNLQAQGPWNADLKLHSPEISEILCALNLSMPFETRGHVNFDLKSSGTWWRPEHSLDIISHDIVIKKDNLAPLELGELSLHMTQTSGNLALAKAKIAIVPKGDPGFILSAQLPLVYSDEAWLPNWRQTLQYQMGPYDDKPMSLERFAPLTSSVIKNLKGSWLLQLKGTSDMRHPELAQFEGQLKILSEQAQLVAFPQKIDHFNADLEFSPQRILIRTCSIRHKDGEIIIGGHATADHLMGWTTPQWDFSLNSQNWITKIPPQISFTSNANLTLSGNFNSNEVLGLVKISKLIANPQLSFLPQENLSVRDPNLMMVDDFIEWTLVDLKKNNSNQIASELFKSALIRIKILMDRNNWVRHDNFTGEIVGSMDIDKLQGQDRFYPKGKMNLQRAVLRFQGRRFNMEVGDLIWQGEWMPAMDMTFLSRVDPYDLKIVLQGDQADKVQPQLSSQPWLDNSDIISVLLIGRPLNAASKNETPSTTMGQDLALSQGASQLSKQLGLQNLGLEFEDVNTNGGTMRIGRYLWPRLYVSAAKTMSDEESQELSVEFIITKHLRFKTTQETETPLGFDLEWSKDY